ncbi:MAG: SLC13 family permease, partial [Alphaproteobacteria bacterium]
MPSSRLTVPRAIAAAAVLAAAACLTLPGPDGFDRTAWQGLGLAILAAGLWATAALPAHVTTLCFFLLAVVFRVAPSDVVFAGFHSGAVWMIFAGMIIAAAVQRTGLSAWMADLVVGRLGGFYAGAIVGTAAVTLALAFVVPSAMARTFLLIPPL